jgi:hypothetical protein
MKKLLAVALVMGLASAANAGLMFQAPDYPDGEVPQDVITICVVSDEAINSWKIGALTVDLPDPVLGEFNVNTAFATQFLGVARDGQENIVRTNWGGTALVNVEPGPWGCFTIDLSNVPVSTYITIDDYAGSTPYGGPPVKSTLGIATVDIAPLTLHVIPEPITLTLLGLGGLFLRRR